MKTMILTLLTLSLFGTVFGQANVCYANCLPANCGTIPSQCTRCDPGFLNIAGRCQSNSFQAVSSLLKTVADHSVRPLRPSLQPVQPHDLQLFKQRTPNSQGLQLLHEQQQPVLQSLPNPLQAFLFAHQIQLGCAVAR